MRILFIAPQPFFEERGTPIAIDLLLKALSERGDEVHLLTFHLGENRSYPGLEIHRAQPRPAPKRVPPGLSLSKVWSDFFLASKALSMVSSGKYDLIYAVEEGAFVALLINKVFGLPFVFDMDSSMADQIVERTPLLRPFHRILHWIESLPQRNAIAVIPMCDAIAERAAEICPGIVRVLRDVSLTKSDSPIENPEDLRQTLGISGPLALYIGNLEPYQGIGLMLDGFRAVLASRRDASLVVIGGSDADITRYSRLIQSQNLSASIFFVGRRPVSALGFYLSQADVLISPRTKGINTPMKIYSYLDSGAPVVATNLPTHTQVLSDDVAMLVEPDSESLSSAILELFADPDKAKALAENARELVAREHSESAFQRQVGQIFQELEPLVEKP
jgi:glycosyltransferase involved in cell wall biosynthesis